MDYIKISGGNNLNGTVLVQGSKNAALPIISASVLVGGKCVLTNCPNLSDTRAAAEILSFMGAKCEWNKNTLTIDTSCLKNRILDDKLMGKLRSSVIFAGALSGRFGEASLAMPGGCELGPRPIDMHIDAFKRLGINAVCEGGFLNLSGNAKSCDMVFPFPSVGATQNAMLAAVFAKGRTTIVNAAREPEIVCLQDFLNAAGAKVSGAGSSVIHIEGVEKLNDVTFGIDGDRIAAATYMACVLSAKGSAEIYGAKRSHMNAILSVFEQMGAHIDSTEDCIHIKYISRLKPVIAGTQPYPGFPTDCLPIMTALAAAAGGTSIFTENIFENRFRHTAELAKMGADIRIINKSCVIKGKNQLFGARVNSCDLRGGASVIIAALGAKGETIIEKPCYLDRGYENLCEVIKNLGGDITRMKGVKTNE